MALVGGTGPLWSAARIERWEISDIVFHLGLISFCTVIPLVLYVLLGKKLLIKTGNIKTDIFSTLSIILIMALAEFITSANLDNRLSMFSLLLTPILLLGETIIFFSQIEAKIVYLALSIFPFLALLAGIRLSIKEPK